MTEQEKESLRCYRLYIEKTLNPEYILSYMKDWLTDEAVEHIQMEGLNKGATAAARLFLESILGLTAEGWFPGFLNALNGAGYTGLREAIQSWDFKKIESLEQHREQLKTIEISLIDVDPEQIRPDLNECLIEQEWQVIRQTNTATRPVCIVDAATEKASSHIPVEHTSRSIGKASPDDHSDCFLTAEKWSHMEERFPELSAALCRQASILQRPKGSGLLPLYTGYTCLHGVKENKGRAASVRKLVECLCRSDKEHWPKTFQTALDRAEYSYASKLWGLEEGEDNATDVEMTDEDENSSAVDINLRYSEEAESDNFSESPRSLSEVAQRPIYVPKEARSYQTELAQPAFDSKHTIICAPTGSGKTFVSIMICDHHLHNMPAGQKGKVVFLATKVPVYEQQKKVFQEHFKRSNYTVTGICGETAADAPVAMIIEQNDITVMTPQILVNCLNDGTLQSLAVFTLMIFDECHNTTGNHPYNVLMSRYLDLKFEQAAVPLPQIVGLTASLGVGNAKNLPGTIEHICTLCASLNAEVISTVKENVEDLEKIVCKPQKFIKLVQQRPKNCFVDLILHMMAKTEERARAIFAIDALSQIKSRSFGTQKYEQWIVDVQKKCRVLQLPDKEEESRVCRALFIYTEHLRKYNDALIINEDARTRDALVYLKEFFYNIRSGGFDDIEQQLASNFEAKLPELNAACEDEFNENPKLEEITFILEEEYRLNPQTRTILFVKTRALVAALKNWIEENPRLKHLKPDVLMGHGKRSQNTGMTLPNQKGVLDAFKTDGESKMLIATSVADEGIDIAQCNLVLLYEYTGNVIKMIQVRGRGRAKNSKCFLVTSQRKQAENEENNKLKEMMMNVAIADLQKWDEKTFAQKMNDVQNKLKMMQDSKKKGPQPKPLASHHRLLCGKCKRFACDTDQIRVIEGAHHTVLGESFRKRYRTEPHNKPCRYGNFEKRCKIYCNMAECQHDWGITVKYSAFEDLPVIKVESFTVEDVAAGIQLYFRKWKDVNFAMKEFDINEMSI